jgi:hypothetical protein
MDPYTVSIQRYVPGALELEKGTTLPKIFDFFLFGMIPKREERSLRWYFQFVR